MSSLDHLLTEVAVIGAAGKMGSGISLLLLQEMTRLSNSGKGHYVLHLIDTNEKALAGLEEYLRAQMSKKGDNAYVSKAMTIAKIDSKLTDAKNANLIFEAIIEDVDIKTKVFREIDNKKGFFLSNTSSIPISVLNEKAKLNHRIIGCHFYNPPAVQKLVEIIPEVHGNAELTSITKELAERMNKIIVFSNDVAGFIGNGHFVREILYATAKVHDLAEKYSYPQAIAMVNRVTQDFLIRPMGIFQLLDYVGIDVAKKILLIMNFRDDLIEQMNQEAIYGGQHADGSQKNGFFQYEKGKIKAIYSLKDKRYIPIPSTDVLGPLPEDHHPWKDLVKNPNKNEKLEKYFHHLFEMNTLGATLARDFLNESHDIAYQLVEDKVAHNISDVDKVLENGFFHLYGPGSQVLTE